MITRMEVQILDSVLSGSGVVFLGFIAKMVRSVRRDFRRFMTEHSWLIATTLWTRDKTLRIMDHLNMSPENPPPADLPHRS